MVSCWPHRVSWAAANASNISSGKIRSNNGMLLTSRDVTFYCQKSLFRHFFVFFQLFLTADRCLVTPSSQLSLHHSDVPQRPATIESSSPPSHDTYNHAESCHPFYPSIQLVPETSHMHPHLRLCTILPILSCFHIQPGTRNTISPISSSSRNSS